MIAVQAQPFRNLVLPLITLDNILWLLLSPRFKVLSSPLLLIHSLPFPFALSFHLQIVPLPAQGVSHTWWLPPFQITSSKSHQAYMLPLHSCLSVVDEWTANHYSSIFHRGDNRHVSEWSSSPNSMVYQIMISMAPSLHCTLSCSDHYVQHSCYHCHNWQAWFLLAPP